MKTKLNDKIVLENINSLCKELNLTFIGFNNEKNEYENHKTKLILKCNICGHIWDSRTYNKLKSLGAKCPKCVINRKLTIDEKIKIVKEKCKLLDFTFLGFKENNKNIILKCNKCNKVWDTTTFSNFKKDRKHHYCNKQNYTLPKQIINHKIIFEKVKKLINNEKYEIIDVIGNFTTIGKHKILFKCKNCSSIFSYSYSTLYSNKGKIHCKICSNDFQYTNENAIKLIENKCKELNLTFIGFNTNSKKYEGNKSEIILKCNICNEIWNTTKFTNLLNSYSSCPKCKTYKLEDEVENILNENNISFEKQKKFNWLKYKSNLSLDFYLPQYNVAIECQGIQHFEINDFFGGKVAFDEQHKRDIEKFNLCKENGIEILYFTKLNKYNSFLNENLIKNKIDLIKIIENGKKN